MLFISERSALVAARNAIGTGLYAAFRIVRAVRRNADRTIDRGFRLILIEA